MCHAWDKLINGVVNSKKPLLYTFVTNEFEIEIFFRKFEFSIFHTVQMEISHHLY